MNHHYLVLSVLAIVLILFTVQCTADELELVYQWTQLGSESETGMFFESEVMRKLIALFQIIVIFHSAHHPRTIANSSMHTEIYRWELAITKVVCL